MKPGWQKQKQKQKKIQRKRKKEFRKPTVEEKMKIARIIEKNKKKRKI